MMRKGRVVVGWGGWWGKAGVVVGVVGVVKGQGMGSGGKGAERGWWWWGWGCGGVGKVCVCGEGVGVGVWEGWEVGEKVVWELFLDEPPTQHIHTEHMHVGKCQRHDICHTKCTSHYSHARSTVSCPTHCHHAYMSGESIHLIPHIVPPVPVPNQLSLSVSCRVSCLPLECLEGAVRSVRGREEKKTAHAAHAIHQSPHNVMPVDGEPKWAERRAVSHGNDFSHGNSLSKAWTAGSTRSEKGVLCHTKKCSHASGGAGRRSHIHRRCHTAMLCQAVKCRPITFSPTCPPPPRFLSCPAPRAEENTHSTSTGFPMQ